MPAQVREALRYVDERSFARDLSILLRTAWCVAVHTFVPQTRRPLDDGDGIQRGDAAEAGA